MSNVDWLAVRAQFPGLTRLVHGKPLVYLDNANTAQKPESVIKAMDRYYREYTANVNRSVHSLSEEATAAFDASRDKVAQLLNSPDRATVIFTRGTTEAINLVAYSWCAKFLKPGDAIVVTQMEHHANIVPWQLACERHGATLKVAPINERGELVLEALYALLTAEVKLLALVHVSNALGTLNPVQQICAQARALGVTTLVDGSQAVPHRRVDVQALGCDFFAFTGHKLYGPTGVGVLWGRRALLEAMPPFLGGGDMIERVSFSGTTYAQLPNKFEAGTPNIAGVIGLGAAVDYVEALGFTAIEEREQQLCAYTLAQLLAVPGLRLLGEAAERAPVFSFVVDGAHAHDLATLLDHEGIAVRSGHHCAHPLMQYFGVAASARASLAFYNTTAEVDALCQGITRARAMLA